MTLFTAFYIVEMERNRESVALPVRIVTVTTVPQPPPILPDAKPPVMPEIIQKAPPAIGIPNPVDDFRAKEATIASLPEMQQALAGPDLAGLLNNGRDSLVIANPVPLAASGNPPPDEFVAYEEAPVLINLPPPVYPEMARQAEVEGTVTVRVLIGKDGKVVDAIVANGIPMLNDAALTAARRAVFRPALQQHKPVAVWVEIPMAFGLR
jgi:protein TonB